jgi:hypothetical protein
VSLDRYELSEDGCWVWTGPRMNGGYGVVNYGRGRSARAHRLMYERHKGPIPTGYEIDHTCENPPCVNPAHLDAVTRAEHCRRTFDRLGKSLLHRAAVDLRKQGFKYGEIADALGWTNPASAHSAVRYAVEKGLASTAELPRRRVITAEDRQNMRDLYRAGAKQGEIGEMYGLHASQVSRLIRGLTSGHAKPDLRRSREPKR